MTKPLLPLFLLAVTSVIALQNGPALQAQSTLKPATPVPTLTVPSRPRLQTDSLPDTQAADPQTAIPTPDIFAPDLIDTLNSVQPSTSSTPEPAVQEFVRRDADAVALTLPGSATPLVLHDFDFEGEPVSTAKLHLRRLAPGVYEITSLAYTTGYWRFQITDAPTGVFGMGERFDTLNHAHTLVRNTGQDNVGPKGSGTYKPIPFFMSTTGYGLWLDTSGEATFDFNTSSRTSLTVDVANQKLRIVLILPVTSGPKFPQILSRFAKLAGPVILPPYWAFAPWQARDFHRNQAEVLEDIDRTRELGLPASVILIDSPWATAYNSYLFNPKQFGSSPGQDAPAMIHHLHQQGYKLVLWHTSWINSKSDPPKEDGFGGKIEVRSPNYAEAAENGFFVRTPEGEPFLGHWWKGEGSLIDFTNPRAKIWWQDQVRKAIRAGADGFKDDDAEGNFLGMDGEGAFADGSDPRVMRNRYAVLYNNAMEELIQNDLKGNGVLFARSVSTGANGIGFLWGGDNEASFSPENGLPSVVTAGLGAGLSAMPLWAADIGGYLKMPDTPNALLLQRWTEFAAFTPAMEVMSQANLTPWTFDRQTPGAKALPTPAPLAAPPASIAEPSALPAPTPPSTTPALDTYRKFATLHMSLFPYRYAAAQQAATFGAPILRALVLDFEDDAKARSIRDEYMFGPDLLVAPVIDENTSRAVYLPAGEWLNLFTGEAFTGPRSVVAPAPPDTIPVYARRGTILPKIPEDVMTLVPAAESGNKTIHTLDNRRVYELLGPASSSPTIVEDFENRKLVRIANTLTINGKAPAHIILRWRFSSPSAINVNGVAATPQEGEGYTSIEFDYTAPTRINWQ